MTIHFTIHEEQIVISGNTYPVKESIKALGGRFNGADKNWLIPYSDQSVQSVESLCEKLGGKMTKPDASAALAAAKTTDAATNPDLEQSLLKEVKDSWSIRRLMDHASLALTSAFPKPVWVVGEIQNISVRSSGDIFRPSRTAPIWSPKCHDNRTYDLMAVLTTDDCGPSMAAML